jgi:hypothetical protein
LGKFIFSVPPNTTSYTQRLNVSDSTGVLVDVTAGLDITKRPAFWIFHSIDTAKVLQPLYQPNAGFLPVNDSMTYKGEGFDTLTIQPITTAHTRDSITPHASILFDTEETVATQVIGRFGKHVWVKVAKHLQCCFLCREHAFQLSVYLGFELG